MVAGPSNPFLNDDLVLMAYENLYRADITQLAGLPETAGRDTPARSSCRMPDRSTGVYPCVGNVFFTLKHIHLYNLGTIDYETHKRRHTARRTSRLKTH